MGKHQRGYLFEQHGAFYVRFYQDELRQDGTARRVQRCKRLCTKDDKHYSVHARPVRVLHDEFMAGINRATGPSKSVRIAEFWTQVYLPFIERNRRPSTVAGYKQIWAQHLAPAFGNRSLNEYETTDATTFLTALAERTGERTFAHIKNLASGIFSHAAATIKGQGNPFADARTLVRPKKHAETHAYSLGEVEDIISALVERVDAQLVVALAFFLGLRPGEIAGLQWGDVDSEHVHIRRAVVRGNIGNLKTDESVASLPLLEPVKTLLVLWNQKSGSPSEGWIFQNRMGKPADLRELARRVIIPALAAKKIAWHGLYAGRRGAGTILTELTGDALAAQVILRHKNLSTTTGFYVKQVPTAGANGLRLLEQRAKRILKAAPADDVSAEEISTN